MTFGSLFAGIGGFDLGLERAGMECRWQVEIDDYASRVLAKHWPNVTRWGDVRTFPPGSPDEWRVDVVCAGVPCQPVSVAGKQKGKDDERWMWGECLRIVADLQPSVFVAENPTALLSDDGGRTFAGIVAAIQAAGYSVEWRTFAAADLGAPHRRERVFVVARQSARMGEVPVLRGLPLHNTRDSCSRLQLPSHRDLGGAQREPIRAENDLAYPDCEGLQGAMLEHSSEGLPGPCRREGRDEEQEIPDAALWWWPPEPDVGRVAHGIPNRVDRLRCLGNAVVPQIVELIGRAIIEHQRHVAAEI